MQDFGTPRQPLLGELAMSWREREKMPFIVATYVYAAEPRAEHALRLDQKSLNLTSPEGKTGPRHPAHCAPLYSIFILSVAKPVLFSHPVHS